MINCGNCGQQNPEGDLFCRRCGRSLMVQPQRQESRQDFDMSPPAPYSWKTGEFVREPGSARDTRDIDIGHPFDDPFRTSEYPVRVGGAQMRPVYRCPHCGTTTLPIVTKKVSSAGWVVFTVLLIFTLFLFWIGLLMQEEIRICPVCNHRVL